MRALVEIFASRLWSFLIVAVFMGSVVPQAWAQAGPYQNTTVGAISAATPCNNRLNRTIFVAENIIIQDMDVGFLATHTWRTDINVRLTSPQNTSRDILTNNYGGSQDNYNIRMDDAAGNLVDTAPHNTNDTITAVPPYQNTVRPEQTLAAFNGEDAQGTWTLGICDVYTAADNGQFRQADLFFTPVPAVMAASKAVAVWDPTAAGLYATPGNDVIYSISVTNNGNGYTDVDSIFLVDSIPADVAFYNGDIDDGGPEINPVSFVDNSSGLIFSYASDVAYSNSATKPADFSQCTYNPSAGYDSTITYICIQPSGQMAPGSPDPSFTVSFRGRIE